MVALLHFMGGIHAMEHAMIGLMPLIVMADRNDFGGISTPMHPQLGASAIFVYDGLPGGAGLCRSAFAALSELLPAVRRTVGGCPCETGCPSCVHSPKCGSGNRPIVKDACLFLLDRLLGPDAQASLQADRDARELLRTLPPDSSPDSSPVPSPDPEPDRSSETGRPDPSPVSSVDPPGLSGPPDIPDGARPGRASRRRLMVLDVETRLSAAEAGGWRRADRMGVSVAVLYDSLEDAFHTHEQDDLAGLFERLRLADLVVGFNILRFDYKVLQPFAGYSLRDLPTLDMLDVVRQRLSYRVSLDNLARATLHAPKSADGLQALQWWKEGRLADIAAYCRKDVELTRDLYDFGREHAYVLFTNKAGAGVRIPVDW
jgi:DEAD/DEAH box helicase domain-containing protein